MGDVNSEQLDQTNGQEPDRDQFYLFTPVSDINCRVNAKDYIAFVGALEDAISAHCRNYDPDDTVSFQIGCALLPGGKKLIEIEVIPKQSPAFNARQLGEVINQIASPEVSTTWRIDLARYSCHGGFFNASTKTHVLDHGHEFL